MLTQAGQFFAGLVVLLVGGRLLVSASTDAARRLNVPSLVVGLTLVAWGTSAPELALNLISAAKGRGGLALGNVVGANICNMGLVLGVTALIQPLKVQARLLRVELWLNAGLLVFMAGLGALAGFQRWETALMLFAFGLYSMWTVMAALREAARGRNEAQRDPLGPDPLQALVPMSWLMIALAFVGGLALLTFGGSLASDGASGLAQGLGVPPGVVGVTIVSIGTTLPELITSIVAVRCGQADLALGNAIGSCMFNAGAIFGITGLMALPAPDAQLTIPLAFMALLAVALLGVARTFDRTISRLEGGGLLASYTAFLAVIGWMATRAP